MKLTRSHSSSRQSSGLVATKICLENGFEVTCFDKSSKYGGLWHYRPDEPQANGPFEASVMKTTILNTPKELSAFSDFPPPAELPNFMRHNHYMDYIHSYVRHFELEKHLKLEHEIIKCWPEWREPDAENSQQHIKWLAQMRHLRTTEQFLYQFDRLMVAAGHHNIPFEPVYEGQHQFKGEILHSARLKDILSNEKLVNKRVVVVGIGNSACDAANDIAQVASRCYMSCHRGQWFDGRQRGRGGNRWDQYRAKWLPTSYTDRKVIQRLEARTDHQFLGLKPKHKPSELTPAINDMIPYRVLTGGIILKSGIRTFTENGVKFEGEDEECPIDVAVLATGYEARIRFLDELGLGIKSADYHNEYDLFLNIFAPNLTLPNYALSRVRRSTTGQNDDENNNHEPAKSSNQSMDLGELANGKSKLTDASDKQLKTPIEAVKSLAFIGLVQPNGSLTVISEMQARYASLVFKGQVELPKMSKMLKHMAVWRSMRAKTVRSHSRDQLIGSYLLYMETMAKYAGVMPNLSELFFKDHELWRALMFGPPVPYQWRLSGPGYWPEARRTILATEDRMQAGVNEGKNHILFKVRKKRLHDAVDNNRGQDKQLDVNSKTKSQ